MSLQVYMVRPVMAFRSEFPVVAHVRRWVDPGAALAFEAESLEDAERIAWNRLRGKFIPKTPALRVAGLCVVEMEGEEAEIARAAVRGAAPAPPGPVEEGNSGTEETGTGDAE